MEVQAAGDMHQQHAGATLVESDAPHPDSPPTNPNARPEAARPAEPDIKSQGVGEAEEEADLEDVVEAEAVVREEASAGLSRTSSTATSAAPHHTAPASSNPFGGLAAVANLLASFGKLSAAPAVTEQEDDVLSRSVNGAQSAEEAMTPSQDAADVHQQSAVSSNLEGTQAAVTPGSNVEQESWAHSPPSASWGTSPLSGRPAGEASAATAVPPAAPHAEAITAADAASTAELVTPQSPTSALTFDTARSLPAASQTEQHAAQSGASASVLQPAATQTSETAPAPRTARSVAVGTSPVKAASSDSSSASKQAVLTAAQSSQARAQAMRTLAERVRGMAAQLDALKKVCNGVCPIHVIVHVVVA